MTTVQTEKSFADEFREFLRFLQTLWGLLAGISVLFPLSNEVIKVIPMSNMRDDPPGALAVLTPGLITTIATIATLFVVLITYRQRDRLRTRKQRELIQRQAWYSFGAGILGLLFYLFVYYSIFPLVYDPLGISGDDPRFLIGDFLLLIAYGTFFAMMTRAFMLLGMLEYFRKAKAAAAAETQPPAVRR